MKKGKQEQRMPPSMPARMILVFSVLLLIAGGITLGLNRDRWPRQGEPSPTQAFTPNLDSGAKAWSGGPLPDQSGGQSVGIKIPGYPSISFPANTEDVTVALLNPEGNPCYFTFSLVLNDTGEVLYTSGMVAPGDVITDITLSRSLEAGEYPATIHISTAALTDGSAMNGANVETIFVVQ